MAIYRGSESTGTATQVFNIDGDKGDITVTNGGDTWTIDNGVVTTTKLGGDITPQAKALLNDASAAEQRATLGLGSAAITEASAYATAAQGVKADSAVQPTDIVNMLETSDIGVSVQAYSSVLTNTTASFTTADETKLDGIAAGAEVNVNADWNAVSGDALILNKPTLGTAAATNSTAYATAAQGTKADTALQPAAIGVSVQAYDADLTSWAAITPASKQDALVSGTNIKTINGTSVLGSGDLVVSSSIVDGDKGDITVSASGATWTIDSGVVTTTKLGGDITTAGKALLDDANASAQRTTLGLGTAATTASTDYATAAQGTKADSALQPAAIGVSIQAYDAQLADVAGLTPTDNGVIIGNGTNFVVESGATLKTSLGLTIGTDVQAYDATIVKTGVANTFTAQQTFKELKDTVFTITDAAGFSIDPANGSIQTITLGANRTPVATNFEAGQVVLLGIDDGTAYTITWTSVPVTWVKAGGTASAPTLATTGFTWVLLWEVGTTIYGVEVGKP